MATKFQLPLFVDPWELPTGKCHISYSEYSLHKDCSFKHKLQYIDKIGRFEGNIYTSYGKTIHDSLEKYTKTKKMDSVEEVKKYFFDLMTPILSRIADAKEVEKIKSDCEKMSLNIKDTLEQAPKWLDETFPGWKIHSAEFNLFESIPKQININFKGFIDLIIKVPKKERKNSKNKIRLSGLSLEEQNSNIEYDYFLLDWKTCNFFWTADKRRDFKTQMQLMLYKHFFATKFNIPLKNIKTGFILIRTNVPKTNNERFQLFQISAGEKTIERSLQEINAMINSVRKKIFLKNRSSCKYCEYKNSKYCP